jgi:hypothetical protein
MASHHGSRRGCLRRSAAKLVLRRATRLVRNSQTLRGPCDHLGDVVGFLVGEQIAASLGVSAPAGIQVDHRISLLGPPDGVGCFPAGLVRDPQGLGLVHDPELRVQRPAAPLHRGHVVFAVGVRRHDDRERLLAPRAEEVQAQGDSVAHPHRHIFVLGDVGGHGVDGDGRAQRCGNPRPGVGQGSRAVPRAIEGGLVHDASLHGFE